MEGFKYETHLHTKETSGCAKVSAVDKYGLLVTQAHSFRPHNSNNLIELIRSEV